MCWLPKWFDLKYRTGETMGWTAYNKFLKAQCSSKSCKHQNQCHSFESFEYNGIEFSSALFNSSSSYQTFKVHIKESHYCTLFQSWHGRFF